MTAMISDEFGRAATSYGQRPATARRPGGTHHGKQEHGQQGGDGHRAGLSVVRGNGIGLDCVAGGMRDRAGSCRQLLVIPAKAGIHEH